MLEYDDLFKVPCLTREDGLSSCGLYYLVKSCSCHFELYFQLAWSGATKAKLKNAEMPRDVQTAERLLNEHKELAEDINAHKPV